MNFLEHLLSESAVIMNAIDTLVLQIEVVIILLVTFLVKYTGKSLYNLDVLIKYLLVRKSVIKLIRPLIC